MIRESILCLAYLFSIVKFSGAIDDITTIPVCEDKSPHEMYFDLSNKGLKRIPETFITSPAVTCVNLGGNQISWFDQSYFDNLPELKYLDVSGNSMPLEAFLRIDLPKLRTLVFDEAQSTLDLEDPRLIGRFHRNPNVSFSATPKLKKLSLRNLGVTDILTWLKYFNVENLTHLYLAKNNLKNGKLPSFIGETLTHLNMDDNQVSVFMTNCPELRYLSMDRNDIQSVCNGYCVMNSMVLPRVPKLEYLSLMENEINGIAPDAFECSHNLRVLNLALNQLTSLPTHLFDDVTSLKNLSLAHNKFTEVPHICGLIELEILIMKGNHMESIDDRSFCNLSNLISIDLSHNRLTSVSDGTFGQRFEFLVLLDLSWNNISALPENWLGSGPVTLNTLNLKGNSFTDIANMSLGRLEKLDTLRIGYNSIKTFTIRSIMNLPPDTNIDLAL